MPERDAIASQRWRAIWTDSKAPRRDELASAAEQLSSAIQEISGAAAQIMTAVEQISRGGQQQASATQQASAALNQIEKSATAARENAGKSLIAPNRALGCWPRFASRFPNCRPASAARLRPPARIGFDRRS